MVRVVMLLLLVVVLLNLFAATTVQADEPEDPLKAIFTREKSTAPVNYNPWSFMIFVVVGTGIAFMVFRGIRPV